VSTVSAGSAPSCSRLPEIRGVQVAAATCTRRRVQEVRVIKQVEEVGLECHASSFIDLERLRHVEIDQRRSWPDKDVATDRSVTPKPAVD